jgi:hypothetical protein
MKRVFVIRILHPLEIREYDTLRLPETLLKPSGVNFASSPNHPKLGVIVD